MSKKKKTFINEEYLTSKYDAEVLAAAKAWIDGLSSPDGMSGTWRVQRLVQTLRIDKDGNLVKTPARLVRFAKGCPWALMNAAKDYLLSKAPYTGFIANGVDFTETFKPVVTSWTRDDNDNQARQGIENQNRHTLTQELIDVSVEDMDAVKVSENCMEETTAEYFWDMPSPPDDSEIVSSVGVTVSVQGLNRQQDGTYNYTIVTRKSLTVVGDESVVECTAFGKSTVQMWYNLRRGGDKYVDDKGNAVLIPQPSCGVPSDEPEVKVTPRQNEDCTWTLTVERTYVTENVLQREVSSDTLTEQQYTKTVAAVEKPEEHIKDHDPSRGVTYQLDTRKTPDGRYEQTLAETVEKECKNFSVTKRRTLQGTTTTTVNKNMLSAATIPASTEIFTVENTRTKSGRYDQTVVVSIPDEMTSSEECAKTVFEHRDTTTEVKSGSDKPPVTVDDAGDGVTRRRGVRLTELGSFEVTDTITRENAVDNAVIKYEKALYGVTETVTHKNQMTKLPIAGLEIGETRQSVLTDGGRWDNTVSNILKESVGTIRTECTDNDAVHQHTEVKNEIVQGPVKGESDGNTVITYGTSRTNVGTWDNTKTTEIHKSQTTTATSENATLKTVETTTTNSLNSTASVGVGNASVTPNSHGTFTERKVEHTPKPVKSGWHTWESVETSSRAKYTYECGVLIFKNQETLPDVPGNHNVSVHISLNEFGLLDGTMSYRDLKDWEELGGSNGTFGGSQEGDLCIYEPEYTTKYDDKTNEEVIVIKEGTAAPLKFPIIVYYGRGNEGSEAADAANNHLVSGLSLPSRTYLKPRGDTNSIQATMTELKRRRAQNATIFRNKYGVEMKV